MKSSMLTGITCSVVVLVIFQVLNLWDKSFFISLIIAIVIGGIVGTVFGIRGTKGKTP